MSRKIDDIAEYAWLKLVNRIAGPVAVIVLAWAGSTLKNVDTNMALAMQQLNQHETRITGIETWRNQIQTLSFTGR